MLKKLTIVFGMIAACAAAVGLVAQNVPSNSPAATAARVAAAQKFLASLDARQTALASYPFDGARKANWHNLPPNMETRGGIPFRDLTAEQQRLGNDVLRSVLSPYGLAKVQAIMAADEYFGQVRGAGFPTGPTAYMLAIYGTPSTTTPWAVQFNGHHLGINVAVVSPTNVLTPTLTAAYPNIYEREGKTIFVLADEATRAHKLQQSLSASQAEKAVQKAQMWNFVLGPGHDNEVVQPEGLRASEMTPAQRDMLLDAAAAWVNIVDDTSSRAKMDEIRRNIADTYWLFSGNPAIPGMAYFRIHGPTVWIEYSPQIVGGAGSTPQFVARSRAYARGLPPPAAEPIAPPPAAGAPAGDAGQGAGRGAGRGNGRGGGRGAAINDADRELDAVHVHTVYRDFTNDYAKKFIAATR